MLIRYCTSVQRWGRRSRPRKWTGRSSFRLYLFRLDNTCVIDYRPRIGYQATAWFRGRVFSGEPLHKWPLVEQIVKKKNAAGSASGETPRHLAAMETAVFSRLMALVEHCGITRYDDGDSRRPGWFTVKTLGAAWVIQVKDPDSCSQLQATAGTLDDALALAQLLLEAEEAPWEPDQWLQNQKKKSK